MLYLCWHRLGCGSEDRALALYIRDAWLGTTNWGTSTNRRPIEPTDGTGRRPQRHRQIRSTLSDTCHGPPTRPFSPRPKASPTGRPYLARVGSGLRRFSVPLLLTGQMTAMDLVLALGVAADTVGGFEPAAGDRGSPLRQGSRLSRLLAYRPSANPPTVFLSLLTGSGGRGHRSEDAVALL